MSAATDRDAACDDADPPCVVCWGVRGSIPSPGPATAGVGGNTSCVEVRLSGGRRLVFDAGTGIRALGNAMLEDGRPHHVDLLLTHFHWDHIQGLPFFAPLYDADTRIRIHALPQAGRDVESLIRGQMSPIYFPIPFSMVSAELEFRHVDAAAWGDDGIELAAFPARHPAATCGYRVRAGGRTLVYLPDNELVGGSYPVDGADWYEQLLEFVSGADLLLHDAMFTDAEYPDRTGWGHSTVEQAVRMASEAGVARLAFFHHAPDRTDAQLETLVGRVTSELERGGSALHVEVACEGRRMELGATSPGTDVEGARRV